MIALGDGMSHCLMVSLTNKTVCTSATQPFFFAEGMLEGNNHFPFLQGEGVMFIVLFSFAKFYRNKILTRKMHTQKIWESNFQFQSKNLKIFCPFKSDFYFVWTNLRAEMKKHSPSDPQKVKWLVLKGDLYCK